MYKEPLMIDKYEALQELYLKDPLKPLQVSVIEFLEQRVGVEEEGEGVGVGMKEQEKKKRRRRTRRRTRTRESLVIQEDENWRGMGLQERKVRERQ